MSKLLTVVGATGTQGISVINQALKDGSYKIRGLTRNPSSAKAKALAEKGVEVVRADLNDLNSLIKAFEGSTAVFAITDFFEPFSTHGPEKAMEIETTQGINLAKAATQTATLQHYIWSTLPNAGRITKGKYLVPHFAAKNKIDDYIRSDQKLLAKTSFFWITWYANNFQYPIFAPTYIKSSDSYVQLSPAAADVPIKSIGDPAANVGIFVLATLNKPEITLPGRFVLAHVEDTTTGQLLEDWAAVTGHRATYVPTSLEAFDAIWPGWGMEMGNMMKMWDEIRELSWSGEEGIVTKDELGIANEAFASVKDAYAAMDWKALL